LGLLIVIAHRSNSTFVSESWNQASTSRSWATLQGSVPNNRIERPVHLLHILIRDFDPKLVLDLVEQFGEIKIGIGIAKGVIRSNTLPAITTRS